MKHYDAIIVGAGIAGMTAAIYLRRANQSVLVFEERAYGGQIINTFNIENWPGDFGISGVDLSQKIYAQLTKLGAEIEYAQVLSIEKSPDGAKFLVKTEDSSYEASGVILAVGAEDKKLDLPREAELTGRGVSYCATCDGALYKDKSVAVIGGGNTALYDALYLADIAKKVYLVHRRTEFRGDAILVERLKTKPNVEFITPYTPAEILGDKKVDGLVLRRAASSEASTDDELRLSVDGIFVAVGKRPMGERFANLVKLDDKGYIIAGEDCHTSCPGVMAAGDCRTKSLRQLITAAADGAIAASELST